MAEIVIEPGMSPDQIAAAMGLPGEGWSHNSVGRIKMAKKKVKKSPLVPSQEKVAFEKLKGSK